MTSTITENGLKIALNRAYDSSTTITVPSVFKVGVDQTTANKADTDLDNPVPISGTESVDDCEATTGWVDSADMTVSLNSTTFKEGSGSLNLTKDGTGSASASTSKTTTSLDFTDKKLMIWIYIDDQAALDQLATSDALSIRFGSGSGDYNQWNKDKADLSIGWNLIDNLTSANADSTTGTPVLAASDFTLVQLTATGSGITWSAGDFIMDDIRLGSSDDFTKAFTSTTIDNDTKNVEIRCDLSSVEANGFLINGFGTFNIDAAELMDGIDDFSSESKTNTDEFIFTAKTRFQVGTETTI